MIGYSFQARKYEYDLGMPTFCSWLTPGVCIATGHSTRAGGPQEWAENSFQEGSTVFVDEKVSEWVCEACFAHAHRDKSATKE